jgi:hypothetical protein
MSIGSDFFDRTVGKNRIMVSGNCLTLPAQREVGLLVARNTFRKGTPDQSVTMQLVKWLALTLTLPPGEGTVAAVGIFTEWWALPSAGKGSPSPCPDSESGFQSEGRAFAAPKWLRPRRRGEGGRGLQWHAHGLIRQRGARVVVRTAPSLWGSVGKSNPKPETRKPTPEQEDSS